MTPEIAAFINMLSTGLQSFWQGVVLKIVYVEWIIAIPLVLAPILRIVTFLYSQLDTEGGD